MEMNDTENPIHYTKKIGAFRPHFQGKPQNFYTLTNFDICCGVFSCCSVIILTFGVAVGLYFWSQKISTDSLIAAWSINLLVFIPLFMITAFCFSKGKAEVQEQLIRKALEKQVRKKAAKEIQLANMKNEDSYGIYENNRTEQAIIQK